jgi:hypothetical protein
MSVVTGIFLCANLSEPRSTFKLIDQWLRGRDFTELHQIDEYCCNTKHPQMSMFGGGYNYFPNKEFTEFVTNLPWKYPENFVLVLKPEDGPTQISAGDHALSAWII